MSVCEMCGDKQAINKCLVEGVEMNVCEKCSRFGKVMKKILIEAPKKQKEATKHPEIKAKPEEKIEVIILDYAGIIRKARDKMGLKQNEFAKLVSEKESVIHNLESGKMKPDIKLAKKLERLLHIRLVMEIADKKEELRKGRDSTLTIGDVLKI